MGLGAGFWIGSAVLGLPDRLFDGVVKAAVRATAGWAKHLGVLGEQGH